MHSFTPSFSMGIRLLLYSKINIMGLKTSYEIRGKIKYSHGYWNVCSSSNHNNFIKKTKFTDTADATK